MRRIRLLAYLVRYFGVGWLVYRARYAMERRIGLHAHRERFLESAASRVSSMLSNAGYRSAESYSTYRRQEAPAFFFASADRAEYRTLFSRWDQSGTPAHDKAQRIKSGMFTYFEHTDAEVGFPPNWHRNPFTGVTAPSNLHWSRIDQSALGDVKVIWELSRFACVYALVRDYWRTDDNETAEAFWRLIEDWDRANPAGQGVNWRCSQEIAIRVMAWCVGLHGFLDADATTPDRIARMARMMWTSGHRIALDLPDAISQKNNHGMSAATGLLTIGILFPEFPESRAWVARARSILERLGRELIYADGAFVQHSLNYQRLMLHDYLWALRLGQLAGVGFSDELRNLVRRSAELLWRLQDESTGSVPQYGQFDGALILPLDNCDYLDFRPVTQAVGYLMDGKKWWRDGPWDEALLWLFGPPALTAPVDAPERVDVVAPDGGYYTLRAVDTFVMTRCATFRHRPGQPDMLHVDVWWRGQNVAIDAGTFSYADDNSPWQELVRTRAHNTVSVDDADQMERFGRFLWFPWLTSTLLHRAHVGSGDDDYWEGEHDGYARRGVRHRRRIVRLPASAWVVIDLLEASQDHSYRLHWLLPDGSHEWDASTLAVLLRFREGNYAIQVATRGGTPVGDLQRASPDGAGWRSKYYYSREPAASLSVSTQAATQTFVTILAPAPASVRMDEHGIDVTVDGRLHRLDAEGGPLEAR